MGDPGDLEQSGKKKPPIYDQCSVGFQAMTGKPKKLTTKKRGEYLSLSVRSLSDESVFVNAFQDLLISDISLVVNRL